MQNLEANFEIKASKEYKNMTREISKIVYNGDRFIRIKGLCDAVLCLGWMLVVTFLCVKFWRHDIGGLLEEYGYCEVSYLPTFVWFGSPVLFFYSLALRPYLLMRKLLGKANFSEMGRKSVTLGDDFLIQRSERRGQILLSHDQRRAGRERLCRHHHSKRDVYRHTARGFYGRRR